MMDNYKDDMKELRGQETVLEQKLKERQRIFQQKGDTRDVSTPHWRGCYLWNPIRFSLLIDRLPAEEDCRNDADGYQEHHEAALHLWARASDHWDQVRFTEIIIDEVVKKKLRKESNQSMT